MLRTLLAAAAMALTSAAAAQATSQPFPETGPGAADTTGTLANLRVTARDIAVGTGESPAPGKVVILHLKAWDADGHLTDATLKMRTPVRYFFASGWMPPYIDNAIASMRVGGRRELTFSEPARYSIGVHPFDSQGSTGKLASRLELALIRVEDPVDFRVPRFH